MNYLWQHPDWPNFQYDSQAIHDLLYSYAIESSKLAATVVGLPDHLEQEANIDLIVSEAIETMAIEGESLDRPSVVSSIKNQLGLNQPLEPLKNPKATQITALLLTVREHLNKPLSKAELIRWKKMLFGETWNPSTIDKEPWRTVEMSVIPVYQAVPLKQVEAEMERYLDWYNSTTIEGPVRAAIAHLWFEIIHPFEDGNGRVGRAIAEHALAQELGRPPLASLSAAIQAKKADYYQALENVNQNLDITSWIIYFLTTIIQSQRIARLQIDRVLTKAKFFDKYNHQINDRQRRAISYMFDAELGVKERSINRNKYTSMIKQSSKTAQRDLQDMLKKGIIIALPERGRSTRYTLKLNEFTQAITRVELVEIAKQFSEKYNVSAAIEYLSYEGIIKKITDRLIVQSVAKNHLIVHRKDQLAKVEPNLGQNVYIDYSIGKIEII
jgi:Fic family protein